MTDTERLFGQAMQRFQGRDAAGAEVLLRQALDQTPRHVPSLSLLAQIAGRAGRDAECVDLLERAIAHGTPDEAAAAGHWLGAAHRRAGRSGETVSAWRRALDTAQDPDLLNSLGVALKAADDLDGSAAGFERALARRPSFVDALYNLAGVRKDEGRTDEAVALLRKVIGLAPELAAARFALCMAHLPPVYADAAEVEQRRADYATELDALIAHAERVGPAALAPGVGAAQPFDLVNQGCNDADLQRRYGGLVCRAMAAAVPPAPLAAPPAPGERLRVGIVCGQIRDHSVWRLPTRGWVEGLDRARFELIGFHTGVQRDAETARAAGLFDGFVEGARSPEAWRAAIVEARPHALIYPEIGMDPMAARLAALRLAPAQYASWGHPSTSGYPTIDYYLSSDAMEPIDAQAHYTEALVRLPGLSTPGALPSAVAAASRTDLGLADDEIVYWSGQSLTKYLPKHDGVFAEIAARSSRARFVFLEFPGAPLLTQRFRSRLATAFAARGLDAERFCRILPRLTPWAYRAAAAAGDVMLDTPGWSGCNSILDAFAQRLPVVTWPGETMRSRHGEALLRTVGLDDWVCGSRADYIDKAIALGHDPAARAAVRRRLEAGLGALAQPASVAALADHLIAAVARG